MTLRARNITVALARRAVVKEVDFEAHPGELHAIVGPNGAGKTTLARAIANLIPIRSGSVDIDSRDLGALPSRDRARLVGYVPQQGHLDYPFTVREVVEMGRYAHSDEAITSPSPVDTAIIDMQLSHLSRRPVTQLSGGERQRVLIARVLSQDPKALLLDEPIANLDLGQASHLLGLLRKKARAGHIVVAILHDLETASRIADRVTLLHSGRVLQTGTPREVLADALLSQAFGADIHVLWDANGARLRVESEQNG